MIFKEFFCMKGSPGLGKTVGRNTTLSIKLIAYGYTIKRSSVNWRKACPMISILRLVANS
jgi:hypothetical protein